MEDVILIIEFILVVLLTIMIMVQKSSSIGLGAYSGSNESVFGAKGPGGFLTNLTFALLFIFVGNTIFLGYLFNEKARESVVENVESSTLNETGESKQVQENDSMLPPADPPLVIPATSEINETNKTKETNSSDINNSVDKNSSKEEEKNSSK